MPRVELSPPPTNLITYLQIGEDKVPYEIPYQLMIWLNSVFTRVGQGPFAVQGYSVQALPDPTKYGSVSDSPFSSIIFIKDEAGGPTLAFSDGTTWKRCSDNQSVS